MEHASMELVASLIGALIGGAFALAGGWLAFRLQSKQELMGVAGALLAELAAAERLMRKGKVAAVYQRMLDEWKETGEVQHRQLLAKLFHNEPQDTLPVYYAMAGKLGLLPRQLASDVVEYHATIIALPRTIVRFLAEEKLDPAIVRDVAVSIERQWHESSAMRTKLITELGEYATAALLRGHRHRIDNRAESTEPAFPGS
jgi:hypothetical protein